MADDDTDAVARLFAQEIPEIAAGSIEIRAIARKPGYRCKLALAGRDGSIDCIGACVGIRGHHIRKIAAALGGERIDLIRWDASPERLIADALQPAAVEKIILHPEQRRAVVVVTDVEQEALALGRGGHNLELASRLSGWQIEVEEK